MRKSNELLQRIAGRNGSQDGRITVSLDRRVLPILEKYRGREAGEDGKTRRASLGETTVELIEAADELLQRYARELSNSLGREVDRGGGGEVQPDSDGDPNDGETGAPEK